jgi:hypothetical protein
MDVYQIQDPQVFLDSVSQVATTTIEATMTTDSSNNAELSVDSGAPVINTSLTLLLTLALVTLTTILLQ